MEFLAYLMTIFYPLVSIFGTFVIGVIILGAILYLFLKSLKLIFNVIVACSILAFVFLFFASLL